MAWNVTVSNASYFSRRDIVDHPAATVSKWNDVSATSMYVKPVLSRSDASSFESSSRSEPSSGTSFHSDLNCTGRARVKQKTGRFPSERRLERRAIPSPRRRRASALRESPSRGCSAETRRACSAAASGQGRDDVPFEFEPRARRGVTRERVERTPRVRRPARAEVQRTGNVGTVEVT